MHHYHILSYDVLIFFCILLPLLVENSDAYNSQPDYLDDQVYELGRGKMSMYLRIVAGGVLLFLPIT